MASTHTGPVEQHPGDSLANAPPCPDPSVHHHNTKLQEQASSAALYVTKPKPQKDNVLDANNKLSSRSAAQSLKYARPEDLPSYPSHGLSNTSSASAAANLANKNQKPFEHWRPDASSDAGKAAMLAKDYKMNPLWKPELSAAGSAAALLAHKDGAKIDWWQPKPSAEGNSAASIALAQKSTSPQLDYGYTDEGHRKALVAATGAINSSKSQRAAPPPVVHPAYPDSKNSVRNALSAATVAHKPSVRKPATDSNAIDSDAMRAARVQNYAPSPDRRMFGDRPLVDAEMEEKKKQDALRASAVSMAKQLYASREQKRHEDEAAALTTEMGTSAATAVHGRASSSSTTPDVRQQALQYIHLQETAQKLAQERLAKLDPDGVARYRAHYGYEHETPRNRLSLRGRGRRSNDNDAPAPQFDDDSSSDDELTSRRIRKQMSGLNNSVAEVDAKKRAADRAALLAAAERKVQAQLHNMDEKVFQETGQVSPAMMEQWEAKARARATSESAARQKNFGKVDIGGGKFMDQAELDAIAQSRLQPTLNEINDTAEKRRAADEERRLEEEEAKRQHMSEKERAKEVKAEQKRLKAEEKAEAKAKKNEAKAAEKARKAEEKKAKEQEKRRSKDVKRDAAEGAAISAAAVEGTHAEGEPEAATTTPTAVETTETEAGDATVPKSEALEVPTSETREKSGEESTGVVSRSNGKLRPDLDRHVSTVLTSSSEGEGEGEGEDEDLSSFDTDSDLDDDDEEEVGRRASLGHEDAKAVAERAVAPAADVVEGGTSTAAAPVATTETKTVAEPSSATSKGPASAIPTSPTSPTSPSDKQRSRGLSGFLGRFKRRSQAQAPATAGGDVEPTTTPVAKTATPPSAAAIALAKSGEITHPTDDVSDVASSSSFRRHEGDLDSISSLSSSEDEDRRGRSGKNSALGMRSTNAATAVPASTLAATGIEETDADEGDEFEEARDHFDEGAVSPPAVSAPTTAAFPTTARSSEERGNSLDHQHQTRFQEEL